MIHRKDSALGVAEKTAQGTRVPLFIPFPRKEVEIRHGLGRIPDGVAMGDTDKFCSFATILKDAYRHIAVFSEGGVNLYMEYQ